MVTNKNNMEKIVLVGAAQLMEEVFTSGLYRKMKTAENKINCIKGAIRKHLDNGDSKRYDLSHNLVAKYVSFPSYETDEKGLKEFLDDYGILPEIVSIKANTFKEKPEILKALRPFQLPRKFYPQFYLNSVGKLHLDKEEYSFSGDLERLAGYFLEQKTNFEESQSRYQRFMQEIGNCPFLKASKSMRSNFGLCKLREKIIEFNSKSVYNEFGNDFLIEFGQISMSAVEEYIAKGYFSHKDIQKFRKMTNIDLRFVIMEKESEDRQLNFHHKQKMRKAQMRRFA
ncbi:hypothetical protein WMO40_12820 [Bacillaceae bacterium CLA-AA-H227]|uniref:Uncharacterized protein n=2 Tax=Robertmurraya TaxID=2837507 RepID=A0A4U1CZ02_9BACI|nr:hypothetical protein [Robertmurraya kyonggiensis]TKC15122.1 hypothetical protein FA727_19730 [Robertmurraya kyonggiensis]